MILLTVYISNGVSHCRSTAGRSFGFDLVNRFVTAVIISRVQTAFGSDGRVDLGGGIVEVVVGVACDVPFPR